MEGLHERFLVSVTTVNKNREFEVVPSIGHYAILENDVTVAEIAINDTLAAQISGEALPKDVLASLLQKIKEHADSGLTS